jgi:hypothetical protein
MRKTRGGLVVRLDVPGRLRRHAVSHVNEDVAVGRGVITGVVEFDAHCAGLRLVLPFVRKEVVGFDVDADAELAAC